MSTGSCSPAATSAELGLSPAGTVLLQDVQRWTSEELIDIECSQNVFRDPFSWSDRIIRFYCSEICLKSEHKVRMWSESRWLRIISLGVFSFLSGPSCQPSCSLCLEFWRSSSLQQPWSFSASVSSWTASGKQSQQNVCNRSPTIDRAEDTGGTDLQLGFFTRRFDGNQLRDVFILLLRLYNRFCLLSIFSLAFLRLLFARSSLIKPQTRQLAGLQTEYWYYS